MVKVTKNALEKLPRMAFVETNPERLNRLNEAARSKKNRDLGFVESPLDFVDNIVKSNVGNSSPTYADTMYPWTYKPGGNFLHRPLIDVPYIHFGTTWFTMQGPFRPKFCQVMERDYFRCVTRVGLINSNKLCTIYWEDLHECQTHEKQRKRVAYMRKVRNQKKVPPIADIPYNAYTNESW